MEIFQNQYLLYYIKNIIKLSLVSLFLLSMIPNNLLSQDDNLLTNYINKLNLHQGNDKYIDSLSLEIYKLHSLDQPELLKDLAQYLFQIYEKNNSKRAFAWFHFYKGFNENIDAQYTESVYNLEEALSLFRELDDNYMIANTYNQLGLTYYQQGNNTTAVDYLLKALRTFEKYNYNEEIYAILTNLGILHLDFAPEKSIEYIMSAINSAKLYNKNSNFSLVYIQMAKAYIKIKDYKNAERYINLSKENNKNLKSIFVDELVLLYQAKILKENGDFYRALKNYQQLTKNKILNDRDYLFTIHYNIADIYLKQSKFKNSIEYFNLAMQHSIHNPSNFEYADIYEGLSIAYSKINQIDSAIKYFNDFITIKSKTFSDKGNTETQKLLYDYELNKKELDFQKALLERKKSDEQIKNFIIIGATFVIVILLVFITIYFKSYRKNFNLSIRLKNEIEAKAQINLELLAAKAIIEESDSFKSAIIRNMTHEIRTPFNGLLGFVSLMKKRSAELDDEELSEYSELVELSGKRVYELISNLNDLALLESNDYQLHFGLVYIPDVINEVYFQYINQASLKGLLITLGNIDDIIIESDSIALSKALKNVVDNAIKFTTNGSIKIETKLINNDLHIIVEDTGIGISEEHIANIGMPFKQVDMSISRSYEGMGVGLAVTKKILHRLNGEMIVQSESDKGTKVSFVLNNIKLKNEIFQTQEFEKN